MQNLDIVKTVKKGDDFSYYEEITSIENEYGKKRVKEVLEKAKTAFQNNNVRYIVGDFSGGNDSGGFDNVYLADKNKNCLTILPKDKEELKLCFPKSKLFKVENENKKEISIYEMTSYDYHDITNEDFLSELLYDCGCLEEYGSFAGEFSVNGTVELDVFTGKWNCSGSESVEQYENFDREGEI